MAYTLEDEFGDIIGKARRGNGLSVDEVAEPVQDSRRHRCLRWKTTR